MKDLLKRSLEVMASYNVEEFGTGISPVNQRWHRYYVDFVMLVRTNLVADIKAEIARTYTDAELTEIYKKANGEFEGKAYPITTQKIFAAMRAMKDA